MTPEEHFRRMRSDEVWNLEAPPRPAARRAGAVGGLAGRRTQIWTTAVVAAAVVAVAGVAIAVAPARGGVPSAPGGAAAPSAQPSISLSPSAGPAPATPSASSSGAEPSAEPAPASAEPVPSSAVSQAATAHGGRPAYEFVAADRADVARGKRAVDCLHAEGVRYVDLSAPDADGIRYLEYGGDQNDQRSITLGLRYSDACIAAAAKG